MDTIKEIPTISSEIEKDVATAVARFFDEVQTVDTDIGDVKRATMRGMDDCMVCGHIEQLRAPRGQIMIPVGRIKLSNQSMFNHINSKNLIWLMRKYYPDWLSQEKLSFEDVYTSIIRNKNELYHY